MIPSDQIRAEATETQENCDSGTGRDLGTDDDPHDTELMEDDAWLEACRNELHETTNEPSETADSRPDSLTMPHQMSDDGDNLATQSVSSDATVATDKTGDDAMSKFGHAIGALAESEDDFEDHSLDYSAERANPASASDEAVAPHIAAAERELESSRNSGGRSLDIFDRIAQAAESQFDETRGSTAKRVSELVDDRRVGTKRWTPSKTMKQRMEKLEAARAAAAGEAPAPSMTNEVAAGAAVAGAAAMAASAPSSSTATMVTPKADRVVKDEAKADAELMAEEQRVAQTQPAVEDSIEANASSAADAVTESDEIEDDAADTLRIIPGARGRRRDRARKSRLDEDFEKVFDDDGKPSINSLRRKLRSTASAEAEANATGAAVASVGDETLGDAADAQPKKKGLFSRLLQPKAKIAPEEHVEAITGSEEDELVAAFEASSKPLGENSDLETFDGEDLQAALETERKQRRIALPIIAIGAIIGLVGVGWVAYRFLFG